MFTKLDDVEARFEQISMQLQDPQVTQDQARFRDLMRDYSALGKIVSVYRSYKKVGVELTAAMEMVTTSDDPDLRKMAKDEVTELEKRQKALEGELKLLLLPRDPNDEKNIIIEIRAGAGGDEASLFAEELFRAYAHFADRQGWQAEILSLSPGNVGGYKEVVASITGERVYSRLKYESGVHRVQRIPATEAQGRVHTSTVTVAVLPEADEVDIQINPVDLKIDVYRSSGAGGQSVNTTDSAVRITHIPTGIVVACQDERSQLKNKSRAMKILYARFKAKEEEKAVQTASEARLNQIGTGDRSERIRTYNFPQSRVTDHRIGLTLHQLSEMMDGSMEQVIDPVAAHFQAELLQRQKSPS